MHPLERRIVRLLETTGGKHPSIAWLNVGETMEQARARWLADHPAEDSATELMFITWRAPAGAADETEG
jgi:hypothetical protein